MTSLVRITGMKPKFAVSVVAGAPRTTIESAQRAEAQGFDVIYVGDIQSTHRELYTTLTLIATSTERIVLGPGVTNPVTRHPAVTAGGIATLDEIAPGRVFLGMGTGDSAVHNIGQPSATLADTEATLRCIQDLWTHGETTFRDKTVRGRRWSGDIPVGITAHGPRALAMAGRIADAVIAGIGMTPEAVEYTREHIERGARAAGRSADDIEIWYLSYPHVGEGDLRREVGSVLAAGGNLLAKSPAVSTVPDRYRGAFTELAARYDYARHVHSDADGPNAVLIEELGIADYLAERFGLIGTPDEIAEQVDQHRGRRVDNYWNVYSRDDLAEHVDRWGRDVINGSLAQGRAAVVSPKN